MRANLFADCTSLKTISVDENWTFAPEATGVGMFVGCTSLVGGNGTTYDAEKTGIEYAKIDADGDPGYFTQTQKS